MGTLTRNGLITVFRNHLQELRKLIPQIITHQKNPNNSLHSKLCQRNTLC